MKRALLLIAVAAALAGSATAAAKPSYCTRAGVAEILKASGRSVDAGVEALRCGDVTHDGTVDAVFTIASGGTAGATHFGVIRGASDTSGKTAVVLFKPGYKVGVARVSSRRFDVEQPIYEKNDANCCPSAFDITPYRWTGDAFKAGNAKRHKKSQKRFYD